MNLESVPVSSIMTKNVIVQIEDQTIQAISRTMYENNIGNVPIARNSVVKSSIENQNRIVGIITERDVVRIVASFDQPLYHMPVFSWHNYFQGYIQNNYEEPRYHLYFYKQQFSATSRRVI